MGLEVDAGAVLEIAGDTGGGGDGDSDAGEDARMGMKETLSLFAFGIKSGNSAAS